MKKIMMAAAIALAAISLNAATYNWSASGSFFDGTGTTGKIADNTSVYLMFESIYSQADLISDFASSGAFETSKAIGTSSIATAKLTATVANASVTSDQNAYMAIIFADRLYLSETITADYQSVGNGSAVFGSQSYMTRYNNTTASLVADHDAAAGYAGQGWYSTVPEPTSGLLLLLGMAGLALKRKQA